MKRQYQAIIEDYLQVETKLSKGENRTERYLNPRDKLVRFKTIAGLKTLLKDTFTVPTAEMKIYHSGEDSYKAKWYSIDEHGLDIPEEKDLNDPETELFEHILYMKIHRISKIKDDEFKGYLD